MKQHWLKTEGGEQFSPNVNINSLYTDEEGNSPFLPQYNTKINEIDKEIDKLKKSKINTERIEDKAITNDKIEDNTISFDKLSEDLQEKINEGGGGSEGGPAFGIINFFNGIENHQIEEKCWDTIANMPINSNKELYDKYSKLFNEVYPYYEIFMIIEYKDDNELREIWVIDKDFPIESYDYNLYFESTIYQKESGYPSPYSAIRYIPNSIYSEEKQTNLYYLRRFSKYDVEHLKDNYGSGCSGDIAYITPSDNYNIYLYTNGFLDSQNIHIKVIDQYNASSEPPIIYDRTYNFNRADNNKIINTETEEIVYYTQQVEGGKIEADKATDTLTLTSDGKIGVELNTENKQINFSLLANIPEATQVKVSNTLSEGALLGIIETSNGTGGYIRIPYPRYFFGEGKFICSNPSNSTIVELYNKFLSYFKESYNIRYDFLDLIEYSPYLIFETDNEDIYTLICDTVGSLSSSTYTKNLMLYKLTEETFSLGSNVIPSIYAYTINRKTKEIIYQESAPKDVVLKGHFYNISYYNYCYDQINCIFYDENKKLLDYFEQFKPNTIAWFNPKNSNLTLIAKCGYEADMSLTAKTKKIIIDSSDLNISYKKLSSTYDIERLSLSLKEKGGDSGDKVTVTQTITSGDELAKISVNGNETSILMPTLQEVNIATTENTGVVKPDGTTITITEDGIISSTGEGSEVSVTQILTEGTEIAKITIDGQDTSLYAPEGGDNQEVINARTNAEGTIYEDLKARLDDADSDVAAIDKDWIDSIKDNLSIGEDGNINIVTDEDKKFTYNEAEVSTYYELTKAEYDALPDTKLTDGVKYFITDYSESSSVDEVQLMNKGTLILNGINYSGNTIENNFYSSGAIISSDMTIIDDLGLPEYPLSTSEEYYETPQDGIFYLYADKLTSGMTLIIQVEINNEWKDIASFPNYNQYGENGLNLPLKKKTKIRLRTDSDMQSWQVRTARFMYSNDKIGGGGVNYSTEEQVVGTWIDGSTLYQKTIKIVVPSIRTWVDLGEPIDGINLIIYFTGILINDEIEGPRPIPWCRQENDQIIAFPLSNGQIRVYIDNSIETRYINKDIYITLQYTKNK